MELYSEKGFDATTERPIASIMLRLSSIAVSVSLSVISTPGRNPCFDRREKSFLRFLTFVRLCENPVHASSGLSTNGLWS